MRSDDGAPVRSFAVAVLAAAAALLFALRCALIGRLNANWDEVYFLSKVHTYLRGELAGKLLTFHVHFFGWVTKVAANEIVQVEWMRACMLALQVAAAVAVVVVGRRLLLSTTAALFAVLAGQSFSYVLIHGNSARFDPIISSLFMIAAALVVTDDGAASSAPPSWRTMVASRRTLSAGVVLAIAFLVSIKAVFFLPTLAVLIAVRALFDDHSHPRPGSIRGAAFALAGFCAAFAVTAAVLFAVHALSLAKVDPHAMPAAASSEMGGKLADTLARMLGGERFPGATYLVGSLRRDFYVWTMILAGGGVLCARIGQGGAERKRALQALAFALPLLSLVLYRNAFPYFYTCIVPAAALVAASPVALLDRALSTPRRRFSAAAVAGVAVLAVVPLALQAWHFWNSNAADRLTRQKRAVAGVHAIFPKPVPYVDRCSMVASFPKVGPFMSTLVLDEYRTRNQPLMREILVKEKPQFLLENVESLELERGYSAKEVRRLLPDDWQALSESFVPYWGRVWIAGRDVAVDATGAGAFDLVIAGSYVADPPRELVVDGQPLAAGAACDLAAGHHEITGGPPSTTVRLRTSLAQPPPADIPPPTKQLFSKLGFRSTGKPKARAVDDE